MKLELLTAGTALLLATPALANPHGDRGYQGHGHGDHAGGHHESCGHQGHHGRPAPMSTLSVENRWEAPVRVTLDGMDLGTLGAHRNQAFQTSSGWHTIQVYSMNGTLLEQETELLRPWEVEVVAVNTPMTTITVANTGTTPLFVSGPREGLWVAPGQVQTAKIPAGKLYLTASVSGRHGSLQQVQDQVIWAEPGKRNQVRFDYTPLPTRLVVQNLEPGTVRVVVDGIAYGMLASGASIALDVRPGPHEVDVYGHHGHAVVDRTVQVARGADTRVDVLSPRPSRPTHYASTGNHGGYGRY